MRERKQEKNSVSKQQIEMEGGEQWIQLTDREKSCGSGAWEGECKRSIDYSLCFAKCLGLRLLANLIVPLVCLSSKVMPKPSPGKQPEPEASGNGQGTRYMLVHIPAAVYYPGQLTQETIQ